MPKFFVEAKDFAEGRACLSGEDFVHIVRVQRSKPGDVIVLCDGEGTDFEGRIENIEKSCLWVTLLSSKTSESEPLTNVTIFQGVPKQGKMESIVQKATELGAARIVPVQMHRSVARPAANDVKKYARWQRVAVEAAKQCGRGCVPIVEPVVSFEEAVMRLSQMECAVMPYEREENVKISTILEHSFNEVGVLIGPEGGFEDEEAKIAIDKGVNSVTLGKRILRTETVATVILSIIMYRREW